MISIIIPVYGVEDYIEACLASVAAQTCAGPVECILVDDCSPDRSMERAARFVEAYSGPIEFRTVRHERNGGLSVARNTGTEAARGEWLWFVDSDDTLPPDALRTLAAAAASASDVQLVVGFHSYIGDAPDYEVPRRLDGSVEVLRGTAAVRGRMFAGVALPVTAWTKFVRRDVLSDVRFRPGLLSEDEEWHFLLGRRVSCMAVCNTSVYNYRMRDGSIMRDAAKADARTRDLLLTMLRAERAVDGEAAARQLYWIYTHFIDYDTHLRWRLGDCAPRACRHLSAMRLALRRIRRRVSPLRSPSLWMAVALLEAELASGMTMAHPLFWPVHRASKMFCKIHGRL